MQVAAARSGKVTMSDTPAHRQPATGGAPQSTGDAEADEAHAKLLAHLRAPIRQYDGGWADTVSRDGKKMSRRALALAATISILE